MALNLNLLSWVIFLPVIGLIVIALLPKPSQKTVKWTALIAALASFAVSIAVFLMFDRSAAAIGRMQFEEKLLWIPAINAYYHLGVDGLSLPLVILMTFLGVVSVLISWKIQLRPKQYFIWILLLETSILGVFCSLDLILFFLFWELELIPMYFLISIWGSGRKEYSAYKYLIYTLVGSAFMLAGILSVYFITQTFDMTALAGISDRLILHPAGRPLLPADHRVCHQAAGLPAAYLAARCAYRCAHRGQRDPGRRPAENGRLRHDPPLRQHAAGGSQSSMPHYMRSWRLSALSTAPRSRCGKPT